MREFISMQGYVHEQEFVRLETRLVLGPFRACANHAFYAWF